MSVDERRAKKVLKIDVEGAEFDIFSSLSTPGGGVILVF